jgi:hypothetical protein
MRIRSYAAPCTASYSASKSVTLHLTSDVQSSNSPSVLTIVFFGLKMPIFSVDVPLVGLPAAIATSEGRASASNENKTSSSPPASGIGNRAVFTLSADTHQITTSHVQSQILESSRDSSLPSDDSETTTTVIVTANPSNLTSSVPSTVEPRKSRHYSTPITVAVTIFAFIAGSFALWPSFRGAQDGHAALILSQWTSAKDWILFCQDTVRIHTL